jgi:hypothetical protein
VSDANPAQSRGEHVFPVRIPPAHRPGFLWIAGADDMVFESISSVFSGRLPSTISEVTSLLGQAAGDQAPNPRTLLDALVGAYLTQDTYQWSSADMAWALSQSPELQFPEAQAELLRTRLQRLLSSASLGLLAKALDLATEYGRLFHEARILTDIRPVFMSDVGSPPAAGVLVHTLKVEYHGAEGDGAWYVALNDRDLAQLGEVVERAMTKASSLRTLLGAGMLPYLDVGDE